MLKQLRERITTMDVVMWLIGAVMLAMIIWGSAATISAGDIPVTTGLISSSSV